MSDLTFIHPVGCVIIDYDNSTYMQSIKLAWLLMRIRIQPILLPGASEIGNFHLYHTLQMRIKHPVL